MAARSLNAYLTRLIWLCVGPLILLAGWLSVDHVRTLRDQDDLQAANLARNFATAIDQHLSARIGALNMLAISPQVDDATRWQDIYREAQGFHQSFGSHVILADLEMRMLFNTRVPFGTALPALPKPKGHAAAPTALASGKPAVGDTFIGPIAKEPLVAIAVPALREGKAAYLVLSIFETHLFQQYLDQQALPAGWSLALLDGKNDVIARRGPTVIDGDTVERYTARSAIAPWSVSLEIPRGARQAPLVTAGTTLALALLLATLASVIGGMLAGRTLARSVAALAQPPTSGTSPPDIVEIAAVRGLLDAAAEQRASAETALRASEQEARVTYERFEKIFLGAPEAMSISDLKSGRLILVNDAFCKTFGYAREELIGHTSFELGLWSNPERRAEITAALREGRPVSDLDGQARQHTEELRDVVYSAEAISLDGELRLLLMFRDITERKQAVQALRESEARYRMLFDNSMDGVLLGTPDGSILAANPAAQRMFGRSESELCEIGRNGVIDTTDPRLAPLLQERENAGQFMGELTMVRKDGSRFEGEISSLLFVDEFGARLSSIIVRDVTERKFAAQLLTLQSAAMELVASGAPLVATLDLLARGIEAAAPGMHASILLLEADGLRVRHAAAPSLPEAFVRAIDGQPIGEHAGSCGTAIWRRAQVIVTDIANDPLWADYRDLALAHGLRACWSTPILGDKQQVLGSFALYHDDIASPSEQHQRLITLATHVAAVAIARERGEIALRESEGKLRLFIHHAPSAIAMFDHEMRYIACSHRWLDDYGLGEQELAGRSHYEIFPDLPQRWKELHRRCLAGAIEKCDEDPFPRTDGSVDWVRWEMHPWRTGAGETGGIIIFSEVITERKRMEEERRQIFERITDAFVALDKDWCYTFVNPKAALMFGRSAEDLIGKHIWTEFPDGLGQPFHLAYEKAMAEQQAVILEEYYPPYERWFENRVYPSPEGLTIYFHDITERKQAEAEVRRLHEKLQDHAAELEQRVIERTAQLEAAKIRAEAADRVKSAFLATMSHELRTPLNSIIGFTGILLQKLPGPLNAEQDKQLGIVRNASRHLLALINDVLDISKVEAGELSLACERFDLRALIERLSSAFGLQAERTGLAFTLEIGENELIVMGDTRRVEQVLNNLLSNALKFTPRGDIKLSCAREGGVFVIAVADTGVGIKPVDMDKLFRPFSQFETGLPELREGTGLGLAISKHLVEAMGGQLTAESHWGKGSRFTFTLPTGGKA